MGRARRRRQADHPTQAAQGSAPHFVAWQDASHFIIYDSSDNCFAQNLRSVDVVSGKSTPIMSYSFYYKVARSPDNGADFPTPAGCPSSLGDGVFFLPAGQATPRRLLEKKAYEVSWMPESKVFNAYPEALFSADGTTSYLPPVYNSPSCLPSRRTATRPGRSSRIRRGEWSSRSPGMPGRRS